MRENNSRKQRPEVAIEYTEKPVSGWGGLALLFRFLDRLGVRKYLEQALPDGRTSPNQVGVVDLTMQLFATILTGGSRFAHAARIGWDPVMKTMLGAERLGDPMTLTRYFGGFRQSQSEHLQETLQRLVTQQLLSHRSDDVLDLDSTVFSRCGEQEGAARGYNPSRRGRRSHHPLLAMLAESKSIPHSWLRSGDASTFRGAKEFFLETLSRLPQGFSIRALRADAGFCSSEFFDTLEAQSTPYAVAMKMSPPVKRWCFARGDWTRIGEGLEIAEGMYHPHYWKAPRRVIVIRKQVRRLVKEVLFEIVDWEYHAIVTTLSTDPIKVWRFYNGRGDCENRIKELKYDFNADGFCLKSFSGTEAVFRLNCFLFNLVSEFKRVVVRDTTLTLGMIRMKVFVVGVILGSRGRNKILRLGLTRRWRQEFQALLDRVAAFITPTVAHLHKLLETEQLEAPSPWRLRRINQPFTA
jgi:Transposase DDE domain.